MSFNIYGENAFTFLLFQDVARSRESLDLLLRNLKRFDDGRKKFNEARKLDDVDDLEVWLFPSFGKRYGFGEPDALLLVGQRAFWFEVESEIDLAAAGGVAPLRQLFRFHCAAQAFRNGIHRSKGKLRIQGRTITDGDDARGAALNVEGHEAVQRLHRRLTDCESHFVLLSVSKPTGGHSWGDTLAEQSATRFGEWEQKVGPSVERMRLERCWYVYWNGDLKKKYPGDLLAEYVGVKCA